MQIAQRTLRSPKPFPKPLLTDREVELLRLMRERDGWSYNRLAVVFEVSKVYVQMVCTYRRR